VAGGLIKATALLNNDGTPNLQTKLMRFPLPELGIAAVKLVRFSMADDVNVDPGAARIVQTWFSHDLAEPAQGDDRLLLFDRNNVNWALTTWLFASDNIDAGISLDGSHEIEFPGDGYWIAGDQLFLLQSDLGEDTVIFAEVYYELKKVSLAVKTNLTEKTVIQAARETF